MSCRLSNLQFSRWAVVLASSAAFIPWTTVTAQRDSGEAISPQPAPAGAPVVVRGDTLFTIYGTLGPFTPDERARALSRRIDSLAEDALFRAAAVNVADTTGVTDVRVGDFVLMTVTERTRPKPAWLESNWGSNTPRRYKRPFGIAKPERRFEPSSSAWE